MTDAPAEDLQRMTFLEHLEELRRRLFWSVVAVAVAFFLAWDLGGISLGVFFRGEGEWMTGVLLAPELPLEEVFFLVLLSYNTLIAWRGAEAWLGRRS